jgi:hypothetical protein
MTKTYLKAVRKISLSSTFLIQILFILSFFGCKREFSSEQNSNRTNSNINIDLIDAKKGIANIQGFIFDEDLMPITGAVVKISGIQTVTNNLGLFSILNVNTSVNNTIIFIEKEGYFQHVRSMPVTSNDDNFIKIQLLRRELTGSFNSSNGGNILVNGGSAIQFQSNSIRHKNSGLPYNGKVNVFAKWLDPSDVNILYRMPGDLRGITNTGNEQMLITYGMMNVELQSETGELLQLDTTKPAELKFPVPTVLLSQAPPNVPMWYFEENKGRWIEEGEAKKSGNNYITTVKHFSWWNVDVPYDQPLIDFCIYVIDEEGNPYLNSHVLIRRANDRWGAHGYTNGVGFVCGRIPANTPLLLEIIGEPGCDQTIFSTPIGPYRTNVLSDTVIVRRNPQKTLTIKGRAVNCNNQPIQIGYVQVVIGSQGFIGRVENGLFSFTVNRCPSQTSLTIFGYDATTNRLSDQRDFQITGLNLNVGNIVICGQPQNTINNALVAYYPLNGNFINAAGNSLMGSEPSTISLVPDRFGQAGKAIFFTNNDSTVSYINNSADKNLLPITISLWININNNTPTGANIFGKYLSASWNGFIVTHYKDAQTGKSYIRPWYLNSTQNRIIGGYGEPEFQCEIPRNSWKHFVFTVDYREAKIYLDGMLIETKPWTGTAKPPTNNWSWKIGGMYDSLFTGSLDDIRVYNRVLLDHEVRYLFEN